MRDPNWFQKKWGKFDEVPMDDVYKRLSDLEITVRQLEEKYSGALEDIKRLEEENIETTNELYRLENSLDARIDILAEHCRINYDV
jgi:predicted  nucleic acid-binding Zn-ribbon protein